MKTLLLCLFALPAFCQATDTVTWVELGESGKVIARQIIPVATTICPSIQIKGVQNPPTQLQPRTLASPNPNFSVLVCEVTIPQGATSASIGSVSLALPTGNPTHIAIIGDTGCKGDASGKGAKLAVDTDDDDADQKSSAQSCTPAGWPFKQVAKSAAKSQPDLVIHAGDYVYVKPDNWTNWYYQFFKPASKLLAAAPWIFVRGNHEICSERGTGYFLFLDPRSGTACPGDNTPPYAVTLGKSNFIVLDSSGATCDFPPGSPEKSCKPSEQATQIKTLTAQLKSSQSLIPSGASAMLLTHRPVWGAKNAKSSTSTPNGFCPADSNKDLLLSLNSSLAGAFSQANPTWITMAISGHTHLFEVMTYTGGPLPQVVVGDSGVELSHKVPKSLSDCKLSTVTGFLQLSTLNSRDKFGYGILHASGSKLDVYKSDGTRALKCDITATSATCK
jgi:hypothetical protein